MEEIADIFDVRAVLEGLSCRLAAETIEPKHIAYLRSLLKAAMEEVNPGDDSAYRQADIEFHTYIAKLGVNPFLKQLLNSYQVMNLAFAQGLLRTPEETIDEHMRILDALEQRDKDAAEQEMRQHIRNSIEHLNGKSDETSTVLESKP